MIDIHPHARERAIERGASEDEIFSTIDVGTRFRAKYGRTGFRHDFAFNGVWRGKHYAKKQIEAYAVEEAGRWIVVTVLVKFF